MKQHILVLSSSNSLLLILWCFFLSEQTTAEQSWKDLVRATTQITKVDDRLRLPQDASEVPKRPARCGPWRHLNEGRTHPHCGMHTYLYTSKYSHTHAHHHVWRKHVQAAAQSWRIHRTSHTTFNFHAVCLMPYSTYLFSTFSSLCVDVLSRWFIKRKQNHIFKAAAVSN